MKQLCLLVVIALLLSGCGGGGSVVAHPEIAAGGSGTGGGTGGGSGTATTTPGEAQGVYSGTYPLDGITNTFYSIVLPNDMFYAIYGQTPEGISGATNTFDIWGMMTGQGMSNTGNYKGDITNYFTDTALPSVLTATYVPGVSLGGTVMLKVNGFTSAFSATAPPVSVFDYNAPANLSHITGTWAGPTTITIDASGAFTGSLGNCLFSGTITPDPNKNFFKVTLTSGAAPCLYPNKTGSGVAIVFSAPDGTSNTILFAVPIPGGWYFASVAQR